MTLCPFLLLGSQKRRLQQLASREGKDEYQLWAVEQQRAIWEVFQEFPSVQPSFEQFIQLLPPLAPRWYTIASSSVAHPNAVHLAVSVVNEVSPPFQALGCCYACCGSASDGLAWTYCARANIEFLRCVSLADTHQVIVRPSDVFAGEIRACARPFPCWRVLQLPRQLSARLHAAL